MVHEWRDSPQDIGLDMRQIVKADLADAGIAYLNSRLRDGGTISKRFVDMAGSLTNAFSPIPDDAISRATEQLEAGGVTTERGTLKWLSAYVLLQMPAEREWSYIIEDLWHDPRDPETGAGTSRTLLSGCSVLRAIAGSEFSERGLDNLLRSVSSFDYNGFISTTPLPSGSISGPVRLDEGFVEKFLRGLRYVTVSAFDREGIVISQAAATADE